MPQFLRLSIAALLVVTSIGGLLKAGPITVDGNWTDWGIRPYLNDWTPTVGTRVFFENYVGTDGVGFLGPGWGGQYFDVEAIYLNRQGNQLDFGIVTGFDPDGVVHRGTRYFAGDIFVDTGSGWTTGIDLQTGQVYTNVASTNPTLFPSSGPYVITGGTVAGTADLSIPFNGIKKFYTGVRSRTGIHYFYEGSLDLGLLGGVGNTVGVHWTMSCGNDVGQGHLSVPEPGTASLLAVGLLLGALRLRRRHIRA